jgi:signal transduction histidine kinase
MESEVQRIHQILRQLLDLTRPASVERRPTAVNDVIRETLAVLDHQLRQQGVEVRLDLAAQPDVVYANGDQLKQVFVNLITNAFQAINGKNGNVTLSTRSLKDGIEIKVSDDGIGIPQRSLSKIFDPFFTTKEKGMGKTSPNPLVGAVVVKSNSIELLLEYLSAIAKLKYRWLALQSWGIRCSG